MKLTRQIIESVFWLCLLGLELLVWNVSIRTQFFGINAVTDMGASLLSDLIWIPVALSLPIMIIRLLSPRRSLFKFVLALLATGIIIIQLLYISSSFRYLFVLLLIFFLMLLYSAYRGKLPLPFAVYSLALLFLISHYNLQLIPSVGSRKHSSAIKIMSWNIGTENEFIAPQDLTRFIKRHEPDIICVQEFHTFQRKIFVQELSSLYPHQIWSRRYSDYGGGAILSKYPFESSKIIKINSKFDQGHPISITQASLRWQHHHIQVYNCHLHHSANYLLSQFMHHRKFDLYNKQAQKGYLRHRDEALQLAEKLAPIKNPLIVAGDFNDTANSWVYQLYTKFLKNSFASSGWGLGTTYGQMSLNEWIDLSIQTEPLTVLRIDHVFYSKYFKSIDCNVLDINSDHKPQIVTLTPIRK